MLVLASATSLVSTFRTETVWYKSMQLSSRQVHTVICETVRGGSSIVRRCSVSCPGGAELVARKFSLRMVVCCCLYWLRLIETHCVRMPPGGQLVSEDFTPAPDDLLDWSRAVAG